MTNCVQHKLEENALLPTTWLGVYSCFVIYTSICMHKYVNSHGTEPTPYFPKRVQSSPQATRLLSDRNWDFRCLKLHCLTPPPPFLGFSSHLRKSSVRGLMKSVPVSLNLAPPKVVLSSPLWHTKSLVGWALRNVSVSELNSTI